MSPTTKKALTLLSLVAVLVTLTSTVPVQEIAIDLVDRIRGHGALAPAVYFVVYLLAALIGFSRSVLAIVAGIIFDPVVAFGVVTASSSVAFISTFVIARHFARDWVAARLEKIPDARNLMLAVERYGFRLLTLMRLNPFVPGFVNGYGFGMTPIRFPAYFAASVIGALPLHLIYIYLGWAGGKAVLSGDAGAEALRSGTLVFGAILSILMLLSFGWYGRRAVTKACR